MLGFLENLSFMAFILIALTRSSIFGSLEISVILAALMAVLLEISAPKAICQLLSADLSNSIFSFSIRPKLSFEPF